MAAFGHLKNLSWKTQRISASLMSPLTPALLRWRNGLCFEKSNSTTWKIRHRLVRDAASFGLGRFVLPYGVMADPIIEETGWASQWVMAHCL